MIFLTGDTHGATDVHKLAGRHFDHKGLTRDDYVIIMGDFGFVWDSPPTKEDKWWLNYLEEQCPWTTLFILGNHENYHLIRQQRTEDWHGGRVRRFRPHVMQLVDNEIFEIDGKTFFVRGGAHSIDRHMRVPGKTWWKEEVPTEQERAAAIAKLGSAGWKVDYVLTHEAPLKIFGFLYRAGSVSSAMGDEYARWLQTIADRLEFERWFFGHHHQDAVFQCNLQTAAENYEDWLRSVRSFQCLYRKVVTLDGEVSERVRG